MDKYNYTKNDESEALRSKPEHRLQAARAYVPPVFKRPSPPKPKEKKQSSKSKNSLVSNIKRNSERVIQAYKGENGSKTYLRI